VAVDVAHARRAPRQRDEDEDERRVEADGESVDRIEPRAAHPDHVQPANADHSHWPISVTNSQQPAALRNTASAKNEPMRIRVRYHDVRATAPVMQRAAACPLRVVHAACT
jgi:hypothetical protein